MIVDDRLALKEKFLEYYKALPIQKLAAGFIARNEDTIILWKREDKDFSDLIDKAKSDWAKEKAGKVKSNEWLLERVMKDQFAERKETTGADGQPITVNVTSYDK